MSERQGGQSAEIEAPRCADGMTAACMHERSLCTFPRCATGPLGTFEPEGTDHE